MCIPNEYKVSGCLEYKEDKTCKKCAVYYNEYLEKNECIRCGNYAASDGVKCMESIENCPYYQFYNEETKRAECEECESRYYYINENKKCSHCPSERKCNGKIILEEIENCKTQISEICDECKTDYVLSVDQKSCVLCRSQPNKIGYNNECFNKLKGCLEYSSYGACNKCIDDFEIVASGCRQCIYPYTSSGYQCFLPHFHCTKHDKVGKCVECENGYQVNSEGGCSLIPYETLKQLYGHRIKKNNKGNDENNNPSKEEQPETSQKTENRRNKSNIVKINYLIYLGLIFI
jgi:hypothetical protein